jgi:hypothetical protein
MILFNILSHTFVFAFVALWDFLAEFSAVIVTVVYVPPQEKKSNKHLTNCSRL